MLGRRRTWDVKRRGRQWVVKRVDARCADSIHDDRDDAIRRAAEICQRTGGTLRVKGQSGRVEDQITFTDEAAQRRPGQPSWPDRSSTAPPS
jgi:uncharacterized protein DUF2188